MPKQCSAPLCSRNVFGKGYCLVHQYLRTDKVKKEMFRVPIKNSKKKPLRKVAKGKKAFDKKTQLADWEFYLEIWDERQHFCDSCDCYLGMEPLTLFFDHLLEKSVYKELRHVKWNIGLFCWQCHDKKTNGHPTKKHKELINKALKKYKNETF